MKYFFKISQSIFIVALLLCSPHIVTAAPSFAGEANIYFAAEFFEWKEFGNNNSRLVRESGPRFGIGGSYNFEFLDHHLILKPRLEIIGGEVDYDGHACNNMNVCQPLKTDTDYFGGKIELDLGGRIGSLERASIEPFIGLGFRGWGRDIRNGTTANGTHAQGYTEDWYSAYGRVGLRGNVALGEKVYLFAEAGGKFPFYNENTAHLDEANLGPDVTLRPGNSPSWFAEAGIRYKYVKASIYYDSMRFSKSGIEYSGNTGYYQPKSQADMIGAHIGVSF
jgi:hypothetical protein